MKGISVEAASADNLLTAYLIDNRCLSTNSLERAQRAILDSGDSFGDVLCHLGLLSEADLISAYASVLRLKSINSSNFPPENLLIEGISQQFLSTCRAIPISVCDEAIQIAVANPMDDYVKRAVEFVTGRDVEYMVASPSDIDIAIDQNNDIPITLHTDISKSVNPDDLEDLDKLRDMASDAPVIRYVNRLLQQAVNRQASDIHIEPMDTVLNIRFRVDGLLEDIEPPPAQIKSAITSRLKIMADLDIAERRLPQDGRIRIAVQGRDVDFRVSTTPTLFGESVVLRILNQSTLALDLDTLGFTQEEQQIMRQVLTKPHGIILVTGPTGSGKTTTLYTALTILNQRTNKILTIEDPIEYMLEGINQVQVNSQIGLGFASALRSFLRQDPDIMMIGEIRDYETAQIAVQASLTGHLILSTLHTNTAAGAITRLLDMGVEDFLLASTIDVVMGQRLVRKLCEQCKQPDQHGKTTTYTSKGCPECQHTGFKGRTMVVEILQVSQSIKQLIRQRATVQQIQQQAIKDGMQTIKEKGQTLVAQGLTSQEEVFRVLGKDN